MRGSSAVAPALTLRTSGALQFSLLTTGLSTQFVFVVFFTLTFFVSLQRTLVLKVTTAASASCWTHMPVTVRYCVSAPSTNRLTLSTLTSEFRLSGWKHTSSMTSWCGARNPSAGEMVKLGPRALESHENFVMTSPVFSSCNLLVTFDPSDTAPKGRLSLASFSSVPKHAPEMLKRERVSPETDSGISSKNCLSLAVGRKLSVRVPASRGFK